MKEVLHRRIEDLPDEVVARLLAVLDDDEALAILEDFTNGSYEPLPLTPEQMAAIDAAMTKTDAGRVVSHQEALRRLGLR